MFAYESVSISLHPLDSRSPCLKDVADPKAFLCFHSGRKSTHRKHAPSESPPAYTLIFTLALPGKSKKVSGNLKKVLKRGFVRVGRPHPSSLGSASLTDRREW